MSARRESPQFSEDAERVAQHVDIAASKFAYEPAPVTQWIRHQCATPGCDRDAWTPAEDMGRADRSHECTWCWSR